jgi:hypothetical protein
VPLGQAGAPTHRGVWVGPRPQTEVFSIRAHGLLCRPRASLPGAISSHAAARKKHPKAKVPAGKGCPPIRNTPASISKTKGPRDAPAPKRHRRSDQRYRPSECAHYRETEGQAEQRQVLNRLVDSGLPLSREPLRVAQGVPRGDAGSRVESR